MTARLTVRTGSAAYPVLFSDGLLDELGQQLQELGVTTSRPLFLVTDENLVRLGYPDHAAESCRKAGYVLHKAVVAPTDASKSLATAERLYEAMVEAGIPRNGIVLALGGGVVGDLAGFVAATYYRGIPFIQLPTTLLAHDSSIGGKVGINLRSGKNLVGAFHQPLAVMFDVSLLASLPAREWAAGMAEVIKHGLIGDAELFRELLRAPLTCYPGPAPTETLLARACAVKVAVVERDERESGERMKLNLGHTVGHAVEQYSHYQLNHGEAVSIGIAVETQMAVHRGLVSTTERDQIFAALQAHGLPLRTADFPLAEVMEYLRHDKKHTSEGWRFALPKGIGEVVVVRDATYDEVARAWTDVHQNGGWTC
jgi:3-dehydroquinate synthase